VLRKTLDPMKIQDDLARDRHAPYVFGAFTALISCQAFTASTGDDFLLAAMKSEMKLISSMKSLVCLLLV
jgi:hypothetical protein